MMGSFRGHSKGRPSGVLQVFVAVVIEFWCMKVLVRPVAGPTILERF